MSPALRARGAGLARWLVYAAGMAASQPGYSVHLPTIAGQAGCALDARGLLPIAKAREIVASTNVFVRDGTPNADHVWAALLSLEDAAELCREAMRLDWQFPYLRGWDIEDAVTRFGSGVLPWLEALLDRSGAELPSGPGAPYYFVGTHLLAVGPEAVRLVLRVRRMGDNDPDRLGFLRDWLKRHGTDAWRALGMLAVAGDPAARAALDALAKRSASSVRRQLGKELAARALGGGAASLEAKTILEVIDAASAAPIVERVPWPTLVAGAGHFEMHAIRVVAVRAKKGDDWGILIEVVQGDVIGDPDDVRWPATIQQYTYGSKAASGGVYLSDVRPIPKSVAAQRIDDARIAALDLRRGRSITGDVSDWPSVLALRAAVASDPDVLFPSAKKVASVLGVPSAEVLLDVRAFEHVDGPAHGTGPLARRPSESPSWRSIAEVIATRDPKRFDPGTPNTDWRMHATKEQS